MVVPVLMTSCQFSEYPKKGPDIAQTRTTVTAKTKVPGLPEKLAIAVANLEKKLAEELLLIVTWRRGWGGAHFYSFA